MKWLRKRLKRNLHKEKKAYVFPPFALLDNVRGKNTAAEKTGNFKKCGTFEKTLSDFGIEAKVSEISMGPTVTRYELRKLQPGNSGQQSREPCG
jgi:S-DNA-T family DNA segregation ATPase FtsK/SpoIIIE